MQPTTTAGRVSSVDAVRTLAILAVIAIHTAPFRSPARPIGDAFDIATVINQLARFAVPSFFVLSGYFWARRVEHAAGTHAPTVAMAKRVAFLLAAWSVIYLLPWNIHDSLSSGVLGPVRTFHQNVLGALGNPLATVLHGTREHLWFLSSLLCSLLISAFLIRLRLTPVLIVLAVALYAVGLLGKAYGDSPVGFRVGFDFRDGPFFSLIFFLTGYLLHRRRPDDSWFRTGIVVCILGAALHFAELAMLERNWGTTMAQDYVVGTYFYGTGAAMIALSSHDLISFPGARTIGPLVLGIYAAHFVFIDLLKPLDRALSGSIAWSILYPALVFALSWALSWSLSRVPLTRRLVS